MTTKQYTGSCYVAVVGGETENGVCRDSIDGILMRPGDTKRFIRGTKGYEGRQTHFAAWLSETDHPFMLLLDHDQTFPPTILERLRSHGLPYVSGFYMRRNFNPIAPVWFKDNKGKLPLFPWTDPIEENKLYPIAASGWGCLLIHRDVAVKTGELLKGEPYVCEDDMDIYPYDLDKVYGCVKELKEIVAGSVIAKPSASYLLERLKDISKTLSEEIVPLRGLKDPIGSDIRFPFFARKAGFQLYGDSGACCGHMLNYPVQLFDYSGLPPESRKLLYAATEKENKEEVKRLRNRMAELGVHNG